MLVALLTFNGGVELGQLMVATAVVPVIWTLRAHRAWTRMGLPLASGLVALLGVWWLLERIPWA
jgi:hypothetical protein